VRPSKVVIMAAGALSIAGCGGGTTTTGTNASTSSTGIAGPSEVIAEPVGHAGDNPFTPSVGKDAKNVKPPKQAVSSSGPVAYKGSLPGLYGGTMDYATCDADKMISYLESEPAKAQAWARALSIQTTEISDYVGELTAVTLRTDTRVTNHGFVNGVANPIQSVLQAGTAVFVNKYGQPVIKCYCGNPLGPPISYAQPVYTGQPWTGFSPTHITIIQQSTTIINVFKLYDPETDTVFARPSGTTGTRDEPYHGPGGTPKPPPVQTTEQPPPVQTTEQPPVQTTEQPPEQIDERPEAHFEPPVGTVDSTYTLYASGWQPGAVLAVELTRPDGVHENYSIQIGNDGSGSYTFPHNGAPPVGTYTATISNPASGSSTTAQTTVQG
jgi:hypothetical protein